MESINTCKDCGRNVEAMFWYPKQGLCTSCAEAHYWALEEEDPVQAEAWADKCGGKM